MPITFRAATTQGQDQSSNQTVARPTVSSGDLLLGVVGLSHDDPADSVTASGWNVAVPLTPVTGSNPRWAVLTRTATSSEPASYTFTKTGTTSSQFIVHCLSLAGADTSSPLVTSSDPQNSNGSASIPAPSVNAIADSLLMCMFGAEEWAGGTTNSRSFSTPAEMTECSDFGHVFNYLSVDVEQRNAAGATGTRTATFQTRSTGAANSGASGSSALSLVLRPAITAPTAPTVDAGADATVLTGQTFTRTAVETANGATITSRAWTIQSGPTGTGTTIGAAAALSWSPTVVGTYVLRYSATNTEGTGTDDVTITVTDPPPASAIPALVPGQAATVTTPGGSVSLALPAPATAGNLVVFAFGGDKSMGALTMTSAGPWTKTVEMGTGDSTLYLAWKPATGGEQTITATLATAAAGGRAWVGEYTATGGAWLVAGQATNPTSGVAVTSWATGTTGAATASGLGLALWSVDTAEGLGTPSYSDSFAARFAEPGETVTSRGGLWVAEREVLAGATATSTLSRPDAVQADQMAGALVVFAREAPNRTLTSTWLGIDTVLARTTGEPSDTVRVAYSTSSAMTSPVYTATATPDSRGITKHPTPAELAANTAHWYHVERGGEPLGAPQAFQTMPAAGTEQSYTFGFASCRDHIGDAPILADAINRGVSFFVQHGDLHYRDITANDESTYHNAYDELHTRTSLNNLLTGVPTTYTWSDHDGPVDGTSGFRPAAQSVYRQRVPHPTLPSTAGIHHTFRVGRVRFIVLDTRSYASPASNSDGSSKTKLGAEQKTWLQGLLADPDTPLTMIVSAEGWIGGAEAGRDHWGLYQNERSQIGAWITASSTQCVMLCGDAHMLAYDDGRNSVGGAPVWHAAALARAGSVKGGPYSGGTLAGSGQYGYVEIDDIGSEITATYSGIRSDTTVWNSHTVVVDLVIPITVDDARAGSAATRPQVGQHTVLVAAGTRAVSTVTTLQVGQSHPITVASSRSASTAGQALLTQRHPLVVDQARAAGTATGPQVDHHTVLEVYGARAVPHATRPALGLAVFGIRAATAAGNPALTQHTALTVGDARAATTAGLPLTASEHDLLVSAARSATQVEAPLLTAPLILTVHDTRAASSITAPTVAQHAPLVAVPSPRAATGATRAQLTAKQVLTLRHGRAHPAAASPQLTQLTVIGVWGARSLAAITTPSLVPDPATEAQNPTGVMVLPDVGLVRVALVSLPHTVSVDNNSKIHVFEARGTVLETF